MATKFNSNITLFNKLNNYFKDNIKLSLVKGSIIFSKQFLIIVTKEDLFYCIDNKNENIASFIIKDDTQVFEHTIVKDLCHKQINDIKIDYNDKYCFARNGYNIYLYNTKRGVMKEYISQELIIDMCCDEYYLILLTQSGKVYEYEVNKDNLRKSEKYIDFKLKSFNNSSFQNDKIKMISCGRWLSLALTESGRVFSWGSDWDKQLGLHIGNYSSEPIIIELNDLKIQKISCGEWHSLLLSCDGHIYAFGQNECGEVGNGSKEQQRLPIKLELNNKFIDIASHPLYSISMSQSLDGIYYVWGLFEDKPVLRPQPTTYQSFEHILWANDKIENLKTFDKLVKFKDPLVRNGFYSRNFEEINQLGSGSFGNVFKVHDKRWYKREYWAIKRIELTSLVGKDEIIREYLNYKVMGSKYSNNAYIVIHLDCWFEESVANQSGISLFILMEYCDKTLDDVIKEFDKDSLLKTNGTLTPAGYFIASQIFIQILEGVNHLHTQNPPLIHRDLKPDNILLKRNKKRGLCVKIADFGLIALHKYFGQSHTSDRGQLEYMAPEAECKEYDTKADVYSLGIIFQNLFDLQTDGSYDHNHSITDLLKNKFQNAVQLYDDMTRSLPHKRPNCEEILNKKDLWAMNKEELQINEELENTIASKGHNNEFTVYSVLNPGVYSSALFMDSSDYTDDDDSVSSDSDYD